MSVTTFLKTIYNFILDYSNIPDNLIPGYYNSVSKNDILRYRIIILTTLIKPEDIFSSCKEIFDLQERTGPLLVLKTKNCEIFLVSLVSDILSFATNCANNVFILNKFNLDVYSLNKILYLSNLSEIYIILNSQQTNEISNSILHFFEVFQRFDVITYLILDFPNFKKNKIVSFNYIETEFLKNKMGFIEYSLLEEKGLVDPEFPIDTKSFNFFIEYISFNNRVNPNTRNFYNTQYFTTIEFLYKKNNIYGVLCLNNLSVEQQAAFIYDFWYIELHTIDGLGAGVAHWHKNKLYFTISSKIDIQTIQTRICFFLNKKIIWMEQNEKSAILSMACFIHENMTYNVNVTSFNKYYLGIFDNSLYMNNLYVDIKNSFFDYFIFVCFHYRLNEELALSDDPNEDPNIYYKFPKACYKYLELKGLDPMFWVSRPPKLYDIVPVEDAQF